MWSSRHPSASWWRTSGGPLIALAAALGLAFLPLPVKTGVATVLEHSVFLPFRMAVGWGPRSLQSAWRMSRMAREATELRIAADEQEEMQGENQRLRGLLGFRRRADHELLAAAVVARGRDRFGDLLVVEPADPGGGNPGEPVLTPQGLIGRVSRTGGRFCRVECLTHQNVAVSVRNARNWEGGIVKWSPQSGGLVIEGVPGQADWRAGDRLVTSGLGAAFPRGLLVGWVVGQKGESGGLLKTVRVRPAASAARVDEVFLLRVSPAGSFSEGGIDVGAFYPADPQTRAKVPYLASVGPDPGPVPAP
jgi:rod shape-determining protein MreC